MEYYYYDAPGFWSEIDSMAVILFRSTYGTAEEGIFECEIKDAMETLQSVCVGLYNSGEGIYSKFLCHIHQYSLHFYHLSLHKIISGQVSLSTRVPTSDLNEGSPQFTLTCISTGGPATTVTWTRNSTTTVTEGTETVLDDPVTAQYTHTLNVTAEGVYTCTVANSVSFSSADITLKGTSFQSFCQQIILAFLLYSSTTSN